MYDQLKRFEAILYPLIVPVKELVLLMKQYILQKIIHQELEICYLEAILNRPQSDFDKIYQTIGADIGLLLNLKKCSQLNTNKKTSKINCGGFAEIDKRKEFLVCIWYSPF